MRGYLKKLREDRGLSQQDVAEKLAVSRQYYSLIENGDRQPNMDITLGAKLASALGVSMQAIITAETDYISSRQEAN
jgi:Predicted transcriptional regulators